MEPDNDIQHFLFIYDREKDKHISIEEYGDNIDGAVTAYRAAELLYADQPWVDIVLIGSDSLETIRTTHSTYFEGKTRASIARLIVQSF